MGTFRDRMDEELRLSWLRRDDTRNVSPDRPQLRARLQAPPGPADPRAPPPLPARPHAAAAVLVVLQPDRLRLRFFYRDVLGKDWDVRRIPYQKTGRRLPEILNPEEVAALFKATSNLKHRALLMTMYAAGLRAYEVTHLRVSDIDGQRMVIRIEQGKGRKDRYVMLSPSWLAVLRQYWKAVRPPTVLFPTRRGGRPPGRRAVHVIFRQAKQRAGITKRASPYSLRHACATPGAARGSW